MNFFLKQVQSVRNKFFIKFWLGLIGIILAGYALSGVLFYNELKESSNKKIEEHVKSVYRQAENSLDSFVDRYELVSKNIYTMQQVNTFLNSMYFYRINYEMFRMIKDISSNLQNIQTNSTEINNIFIITLNKDLIADGVNVIRDQDYLGEELIERVKEAKGENIWLHYKNEITGQNSLTILRHLNVGKPGGILVIEFDETYLYNLIKLEENSNSSIYVLDQNGTIVSSSDRERVGEKLEEQELSYIHNTDYNTADQVMVNESHKLVFANNMKGIFDIVIVYDTYKMERSNRKVIVGQIILLTGILFATILFVIAYGRVFANSIHKLVSKIKKIQKGNLDIQETIKSKDEFQYMDNSLCKMALNIQKLNEEIVETLNQKKELELRYLQMQIKPHFLYNSLSSMRWLSIQRNQYEISNLLEHLIQFYKIALSKGNDVIPLSEEIELTESYVAMQNLIYKDQIFLDVYVAKSLKDIQMNKMTLQPFVENSIQHGKQQGEPIHIWVSIEEINDMIKITIEDDGEGIRQEVIEEINRYNDNANSKYKSFGILSTINRLRILYGNVDVSLTGSGNGTVVDILVQRKS